MSEKFWMLYVEDGGKPNQAYMTQDGAQARAKVLARDTRKRVFILEAMQVVTAEVPDTVVTYTVEEVL